MLQSDSSCTTTRSSGDLHQHTLIVCISFQQLQLHRHLALPGPCGPLRSEFPNDTWSWPSTARVPRVVAPGSAISLITLLDRGARHGLGERLVYSASNLLLTLKPAGTHAPLPLPSHGVRSATCDVESRPCQRCLAQLGRGRQGQHKEGRALGLRPASTLEAPRNRGAGHSLRGGA